MCLEISNNLLLLLWDAPKRIFSTNSRSSGQPKNDAKTLFFPTLHPLSTVIFATATVLAFVLLRDSRFNFHCYTQKSARKCAATSRDFLRESLQSTFTLANQICWIAQQTRPRTKVGLVFLQNQCGPYIVLSSVRTRCLSVCLTLMVFNSALCVCQSIRPAYPITHTLIRRLSA